MMTHTSSKKEEQELVDILNYYEVESFTDLKRELSTLIKHSVTQALKELKEKALLGHNHNLPGCVPMSAIDNKIKELEG